MQKIIHQYKNFIPLPFWFCRDYGNVIPLESIKHQEIKLVVEFRSQNEIIKTDIDNLKIENLIIQSNLIIDYINIDGDAQKYFKSNKHIYLIEQVQKLPNHIINTNLKTTKIDLINYLLKIYFGL